MKKQSVHLIPDCSDRAQTDDDLRLGTQDPGPQIPDPVKHQGTKGQVWPTAKLEAQIPASAPETLTIPKQGRHVTAQGVS